MVRKNCRLGLIPVIVISICCSTQLAGLQRAKAYAKSCLYNIHGTHGDCYTVPSRRQGMSHMHFYSYAYDVETRRAMLRDRKRAVKFFEPIIFWPGLAAFVCPFYVISDSGFRTLDRYHLLAFCAGWLTLTWYMNLDKQVKKQPEQLEDKVQAVEKAKAAFKRAVDSLLRDSEQINKLKRDAQQAVEDLYGVIIGEGGGMYAPRGPLWESTVLPEDERKWFDDRERDIVGEA